MVYQFKKFLKFSIISLSFLGPLSVWAGAYSAPREAPPIAAKPQFRLAAEQLAQEVGGHVVTVAATGSMLPTLTASDLVIYKKVAYEDLRVGDIIIFEVGEPPSRACNICRLSLYAHRIVEFRKASPFRKDSAITKGDNNDYRDDFDANKHNLVGVIVYAIDGQTGEVRNLYSN